MTELQRIVTLDVEGVVMPEVWIELAERTGVKELTRTTRDEPNYDTLMAFRLEKVRENNITMADLQKVLRETRPLEGAKDFLDELRSRYQVILLSDTFEQFAQAMTPHLGMPTLFCHRLLVENGQLSGYKLRIDDHKARTVESLRALNFHVCAAGDSFNDLNMLNAANQGCLFRAPSAIVQDNTHLHNCNDYQDLIDWVDSFSAR